MSDCCCQSLLSNRLQDLLQRSDLGAPGGIRTPNLLIRRGSYVLYYGLYQHLWLHANPLQPPPAAAATCSSRHEPHHAVSRPLCVRIPELQQGDEAASNPLMVPGQHCRDSAYSGASSRVSTGSGCVAQDHVVVLANGPAGQPQPGRKPCDFVAHL